MPELLIDCQIVLILGKVTVTKLDRRALRGMNTHPK